MPVKIIAALRVKNEARWIKDVLQSVSFCSDIYLMDDHSTDRTVKIAYKYGARVVLLSPFPFDSLDEARDKEWLVSEIARDHNLDSWVLMIDGDEIVEQGEGPYIIREAIAGQPNAYAFSLRILYLWNDRKQVRVDGVYGKFSRPSLFRLNQPLAFKKTPQPGHLHCGSVPEFSLHKSQACRAALLHLGYMQHKERIRKWCYYNSIDPTNRAEGYDPNHPERGSYPHIVQGDIPAVPADAKLMHSGPLRLHPLEANYGI